MAPEVAMGRTYNKSVDMWALGIIMHIAITGGRHPFLTEDDNYESFNLKLKNLKKVKPDPILSEIA